jgi:hypothetical protein
MTREAGARLHGKDAIVRRWGYSRVLLSIRGRLQPRLQQDGRRISFVDRAGRRVVNYTRLKVWDADGQVLTARIKAVGPVLRLEVDERSARYPLTIDPIAQQAYLKASNTGADYRFGSSVAVSGDTVVVGASGDDSSATGVNGNQIDASAYNAGAAYVFVQNGGAWTQQSYLKASNAGAYDGFVAASGARSWSAHLGRTAARPQLTVTRATTTPRFRGGFRVPPGEAWDAGRCERRAPISPSCARHAVQGLGQPGWDAR